MTRPAAELRQLAETHADPTRRLRGLWGAHAVGGADAEWLTGRLADAHPSVRAWAVRLLADQVATGEADAAAVAGSVTEVCRRGSDASSHSPHRRPHH